ncbi:MAG: nicotinamide mononucleotide transporter [Clostridia bacterium]|nr:nicotinamide mononucleotide transporter [Clostridia bacterium]
MQNKNPFSDLSRGEWFLWLVSLTVCFVSFLFSGGKDYMTLISSLIGVTALIFVSKGYVFGQVLTVIFAVFYGIVSFFFRYYGEMITYLCMTAPIAMMSVISWLKNPYKDTKEVTVARLSKKQFIIMTVLSAITTLVFYYILKALGNANLLFSTISITTSFAASYLTYCRSPYYALAYAANDIVLIVLWVLASLSDISYLPMIFCFVMFLVNDLYGFYNWQRIQKKQNENVPK